MIFAPCNKITDHTFDSVIEQEEKWRATESAVCESYYRKPPVSNAELRNATNGCQEVSGICVQAL